MASNQKTSVSAKRRRLINIGILLFILGVATVLISKGVQSHIRHMVISGEIDEEGTERARQARTMINTTVKQSEYETLDAFEYAGYGFVAIGGLIILVNGLSNITSSDDRGFLSQSSIVNQDCLHIHRAAQQAI